MAAVSAAVLAVHAARGGKTETLCREVVVWGKPLLALDDAHNAALMALGAPAVRPENVVRAWAEVAPLPDALQ